MIELEVYKKSDFYEDYISSQKEYYERENADAYFAERLAEKDKEIALLKERICNGDVSRLTWIDDCIAKDKEIAELKAKLDEYVLVKLSTQQMLQNLLDCGLIKEWYFNGKFNAVLKADDPHLKIAELKQKLEDVQASMYCDVVDANMENRRLKRALWLARANRALEKIAWFKLWNASISTMNPEDGARQEYDKWKKSLGKFLKKAEEYK